MLICTGPSRRGWAAEGTADWPRLTTLGQLPGLEQSAALAAEEAAIEALRLPAWSAIDAGRRGRSCSWYLWRARSERSSVSQRHFPTAARAGGGTGLSSCAAGAFPGSRDSAAGLRDRWCIFVSMWRGLPCGTSGKERIPRAAHRLGVNQAAVGLGRIAASGRARMASRRAYRPRESSAAADVSLRSLFDRVGRTRFAGQRGGLEHDAAAFEHGRPRSRRERSSRGKKAVHALTMST